MSSYCPVIDTGEEVTFEEQVEEAISFIEDARNDLLNALDRFYLLDQFEWCDEIGNFELKLRELQKQIEEHFK